MHEATSTSAHVLSATLPFLLKDNAYHVALQNQTNCETATKTTATNTNACNYHKCLSVLPVRHKTQNKQCNNSLSNVPNGAKAQHVYVTPMKF